MKLNKHAWTIWAIALVAVLVVVTTVIIPGSNYKKAEELRTAGNYAEAVTAFTDLGDYKDAATQITETQYQQAKALASSKDYAGAVAIFNTIKGYKDVDKLLTNDQNLLAVAAAARDAAFQPGQYVTFGHYPQTSAGTDNTPIEWIVLARDGQNALLISRYGLDTQPYNTSYTDMTWEQCSLRAWLNGTFMNKAFTTMEQGAILQTNVDNSESQGYSGWSTNGGNNTQDKVFLLSYAEANKYFNVTHSDSDNTKSRVESTAYAIKQGAYTPSNTKTADGKAAGWWWLRSPGGYQIVAAVVRPEGSLSGSIVTRATGSVRPALWVNLESGIF